MTKGEGQEGLLREVWIINNIKARKRRNRGLPIEREEGPFRRSKRQDT